MMEAAECREIGIVNRLVPKGDVASAALALGEELAKKPPHAMRLNRQRFREMTEAGFRDCLEAGMRIQRASFATGEPARMMEAFFAERAARKKAPGA
jgi:enoyl-CoA hydratase/carnithine racemase